MARNPKQDANLKPIKNYLELQLKENSRVV